MEVFGLFLAVAVAVGGRVNEVEKGRREGGEWGGAGEEGDAAEKAGEMGVLCVCRVCGRMRRRQ